MLCMISCWFIWKSRCKLAFEDKQSNSDLVIQEINQAHGEIKATLNSQPRPGQQASTRKWRKLDEDIIKINCDATWSSTSGRGGVGIIARNQAGHICGDSFSQMTGTPSKNC